ncbi:hypothetical protein [Cronobacter sakazakii]|uniref:hypothetical protein n=1 Tax=Cronobacter sakazakii TaxID=28141 RepID=UPI000F5C63FC|nr:hypothetical protein [Cronobacter sakazakii]MDK1224568.1 hypothetical protein [Cronobacter turicensis]EJJ0671522.1 hypothetical protein [Cronobacter sakazakii]EMC4401936.1 hypothetical protein [Cronobacter sakazakii]KAB0805750.1 hypothetical protein FZI15_22125 [Cronobacter sakazakii]KAB0887818.1 hypothetical protein FZI07_20795 [Cronobacter sakazakii]
MAIYCENNQCRQMLSIAPDELEERKRLDHLDDDVSSYSYSGYFNCPYCGQENYTECETVEIDSTGEMIECERIER